MNGLTSTKMGLMRFALKSSIVGGVIYYTYQEGLWSKSEDSVKFYGKIYNSVAPYVKQNVPDTVMNEIPNLPSTSDISLFVKSNWNKGVMTSMKFLANLPTHTSNAVDSLINQPALTQLFESAGDKENKSGEKSPK